MKKLAALCLVVFVAVGLAIVAVPAYAAEQPGVEQPALSSVNTEVVSVDLEKSTLTISTAQNASTNAPGNTTVAVLPETKITKGDAVLKLSDLKAGDKIAVRYSVEVSGAWKIDSISVQPAEQPAVQPAV